MGCPVDCPTEFRSYEDDAWYNVTLMTEGEKLRVKFENFPEDQDKVYDAGSFKTSAELEAFRSRFRRGSLQVQDRYCRQVSIEKHLCVSHASSSSDLRFYDAIAEEVHRKEHTFTNEEEECACKFLVCWQHGPNAGMLAEKKIESICIVRAGPAVEPNFVSFMEMAWRKLRNPSRKTYSGPIVNSREVCSPVIKELTLFQQEESARWSSAKIWAFEDTDKRLYGGQDVDMEEVKDHRVIFIQNIEKDLSRLSIMEFIHEKTSIACQACVFPSLSWEPSTKGLIILDNKSDLHKLVRFLQDPNHMIVSSRGRPWLITENMSANDAGSFLLNRLVRKSTNHRGDELKVVPAGTMEYERAKAHRDLLMEFVRRQELLYKRLQEELTQEMSNLKVKDEPRTYIV